MIPHFCPCGVSDARTALGAVFCQSCYRLSLADRQELLEASEWSALARRALLRIQGSDEVEGHERREAA